MSVKTKDADNNDKYIQATGTGSIGDPYVPSHGIEYIAPGAFGDFGNEGDAAVVGDGDGTLLALIRGIGKVLDERLPSIIGQQNSSDSLSVVLAADQSQVISLAESGEDIGTVFIGGIGYTPLTKYASSADATGGMFITDVPVTGEHIKANYFSISVNTTCRIEIKEEDNGILMARYVLANTTFEYGHQDGLLCPTANKRLQVVTSVSGEVRTFCSYLSV